MSGYNHPEWVGMLRFRHYKKATDAEMPYLFKIVNYLKITNRVNGYHRITHNIGKLS